MSTQYRTHAKWWGIAGGTRPERALSPHVFRHFLHFFLVEIVLPGCLKQWELDKGRERKTILWSANRKFQTPLPPPPPSSPTLIPGLTLIPVLTPPPPPPCWGLTLIPGWPLFRVLLYQDLTTQLTCTSSPSFCCHCLPLWLQRSNLGMAAMSVTCKLFFLPWTESCSCNSIFWPSINGYSWNESMAGKE